MTSNPRAIAEQFALDGRLQDIMPYGGGLINDTYLVSTASVREPRVILQRINRRVFPNPQRIMANLETLIDHVEQQYECSARSRRTVHLPKMYKAVDGSACVIDADGGVWRALGFIEHTMTLRAIERPSDAEEVGFALGRFHRLVDGLDPGRLYDTLPGFHITPHYFHHYVDVSAHAKRAGLVSSDVRRAGLSVSRACFEFVEARKTRITVLEDAKRKGHLQLRPIHGDPKLNNILFDEHSRRAVSIIDLDTVKPGLIHYDIGDCLRSCCNTAGESPDSGAATDFDLERCRAILRSYCREMQPVLTGHDYGYFYDAIHLIPFELGLRFLTDYLEGNRYFKVDAPEQNLQRAKVQFQLVECIERQEDQIKTIIAELSTT